jgi:hypothetical protein
MRICLPEKYRIPRTKEEPTPGKDSGRNGIGQNGEVQLFYRRKQVWIYLHKSRWQFP